MQTSKANGDRVEKTTREKNIQFEASLWALTGGENLRRTSPASKRTGSRNNVEDNKLGGGRGKKSSSMHQNKRGKGGGKNVARLLGTTKEGRGTFTIIKGW